MTTLHRIAIVSLTLAFAVAPTSVGRVEADSKEVTVSGTVAVIDDGTPVYIVIGGPPSSTTPSYHVPAGQRLVMEFVSGRCQAQGATLTSANLYVSRGPELQVHYFVPVLVAPSSANGNNGDLYTFSQPTRIYAEPETGVGYFVGDVGSPTVLVCDIRVSGRLVAP
jgi:hypothetical protein